jgi:hypothetical protein
MTISSLRPGSPFKILSDDEPYKKVEVRKYYGLALDGATVNGNVSEVRKELLGAVLRLYKFEQLLRIIDELRGVSVTGPPLMYSTHSQWSKFSQQ